MKLNEKRREAEEKKIGSLLAAVAMRDYENRCFLADFRFLFWHDNDGRTPNKPSRIAFLGICALNR